MQITISELDSSTKKVTLTGKLDIAGAQAIETPLAAVAGARGNVVIDMAGVDFISSIGIRTPGHRREGDCTRSRQIGLARPDADGH